MNQAIHHHSLQTFATAITARQLACNNLKATRQLGAYLPLAQLSGYLSEALVGMSVSGLPLKTRSSIVRKEIIKALGYAPLSSKHPKQPSAAMIESQNADVYIQKSNNLQIWNSKIVSTRRYLIVRVSADDIILGVQAFTGATLEKWNKTGTLTAKYQAALKLVFDAKEPSHVCGKDTERTVQFIGRAKGVKSATAVPTPGTILPIQELGKKLTSLIGCTVPYVSAVDEKKRATALASIVSKALGYSEETDRATFPKIPAQMLEVKLQTSETLDLGRTWPSSDSPLNFQEGRARLLRRRDVRFAVFYGTRIGDNIRLDKVVIVAGARFWDVFDTLKGKSRNTKLQLRLPAYSQLT